LDLPSPLLGAVVGLCAGSFVATLAVRAEDGWRGILGGRSRCPACGAPLGARDLVPILSWLWQRGRCRHCAARIGAFYPLVEVAAAMIGTLALVLLPSPVAWVAALLGWWLLALALIDLRTWRLPDALTLPLILMGLLLAAADGALGDASLSLAEALLGAGGGYLAFAGLGRLYHWARGREGLGLGDAKLLAAAGAWLGLGALPLLVLLSTVPALLLAAARAPVLRPDTAVPFGPALALGFWGLYLAAAR
jgi:leader peptidase (prepilin peptidase)/N-methyltransferase